MKGDHFIVFHRQDEAFARDVLRSAEGYYHSIAANLGYDRFDNFWTWEHRVKIYLFSGRQEYLRNTPVAGWSEGFANYDQKLIAGYRDVDGFLGRVLPHEIAHLIFRDFVGMKRNIPIWLDEGVALSQESSGRRELFDLVQRAVAQNLFLPLDKVVQVASENSLSPRAVGLFYAEATVTVDFLLKTYRRDKFVEFCKNLRDGYGLDESLRKAYEADGIGNLKDLQAKLLAYLMGNHETGLPPQVP